MRECLKTIPKSIIQSRGGSRGRGKEGERGRKRAVGEGVFGFLARASFQKIMTDLWRGREGCRSEAIRELIVLIAHWVQMRAGECVVGELHSAAVPFSKTFTFDLCSFYTHDKVKSNISLDFRLKLNRALCLKPSPRPPAF